MIARACTITACAMLAYHPSNVSAEQHKTFNEKSQELVVVFPHDYVAQYGFQPIKVTAVNSSTESATWQITIREQISYNETLKHEAQHYQIVVPPGPIRGERIVSGHRLTRFQ